MEFREVGFLLSIQYDVKLPFSTATTFVAALHIDIMVRLSRALLASSLCSLSSAVSVPSSMILSSFSSQALLSVHRRPRPK